jgi:hypothetical protein
MNPQLGALEVGGSFRAMISTRLFGAQRYQFVPRASKLAWGLVLAFLAVSIAACGDQSKRQNSDANTNPGGTAATIPPARGHPLQRRYVAKANLVCERLTSDLSGLGAKYLPQRRSADIVDISRFAARAAPVIRLALARLEALKPRASDERPLQALYAQAKAGLHELDRAARNRSAAKRILDGYAPFARTQEIASTLRLDKCSRQGWTSR